MPTANSPANEETITKQAILGGQQWLRFFNPAGPPPAFADPTNGLGQLLSIRAIDHPIASPAVATLPAGTYLFGFPMTGMASIFVTLTATFSAGTITASAYSTYKDYVTVRQNFGGGAALVTATPLTMTLTTPQGEQWAVAKLVVTTPTGLVITQAEFNGQRG